MEKTKLMSVRESLLLGDCHEDNCARINVLCQSINVACNFMFRKLVTVKSEDITSLLPNPFNSHQQHSIIIRQPLQPHNYHTFLSSAETCTN